MAQASLGWTISGQYLIVTGAEQADVITMDLKSGDKQVFTVSNGNTGFQIQYSGQKIYLNGLNLLSGYDFLVTGSILSLTNRNTGVDGYIFEIPIVLNYWTGNSSLITGTKFSRNTSNIYFNGLRQQNKVSYIEGAIFDLLSGNSFNYSGSADIYDNNGLFWETY
jgi:hypothetical protein